MNPSTPPDLAHQCYTDPAAAAAEITTLRADNARLVAENAEMFRGWMNALNIPPRVVDDRPMTRFWRVVFNLKGTKE